MNELREVLARELPEHFHHEKDKTGELASRSFAPIVGFELSLWIGKNSSVWPFADEWHKGLVQNFSELQSS